MTIAREKTAKAARYSHVPSAGTPAAAEIERARTAMLSDAKPHNRTRIGADVVCEALLRQGVHVLFGYPGGVLLPIYDILGDYPELRHVLVRHEQGAAHAADGFSRATVPWACAWAPPDRARRTSSRASARRCSTPCQWSRSRATSRAR